MVFFSLRFCVFITCLLVLYYTAGRLIPKYQWTVLLGASLLFYCIAGSWYTLSFMLVTALSTWLGSHKLVRLNEQAKVARKQAKGRAAKKEVKQQFVRKRRLVLIAVLVITLGMLGYLKYWNTILFNFGLAESTRSLGILLPLGISFYTFISLGYLLDVYNDKYSPEPNFARYFLFVSWFPQIIQGPINRFDEIAHQLFASRGPSWRGMRRGLMRLAYGIFKKYAIANVLVGNYLAIFSHIDQNTTSPVILAGILIYTIEMYADFSGCIDIVEGVSELFGVQMAQNFRQPYFSTSLADYWRRWHMSLGAWMRDHVFYPLAVSKPMKDLNRNATKVLGKQVGRTISACLSNVIVFVIVGLWHGAEWHFLAWGLYNGVVIALSDLLAPLFEGLSNRLHVNKKSAPYHLFCIARTMAIVAVGRFFDCIEDMSVTATAMWDTLTNLTLFDFKFQLASYGVTSPETYGLIPQAMVAFGCVFVVSLLYERGTDVRDAILGLKFPVRVALYLVWGLVFVFAMELGINQGEVFPYAFF